MHGDVMAPLMSSNFVDSNIVSPVIKTGNVYFYKDNVPIPLLITQDDTSNVSTCGYKTQNVTNLLNTCTSKMGLQFGIKKIVRMHIGKTHNMDLCWNGEIDSGKQDIITEKGGKKYQEDVYIWEKRKWNMWKKTKYLGEVVSMNMKNEKNIKNKNTKQAHGNIKKI